jgi:hypothetical protein
MSDISTLSLYVFMGNKCNNFKKYLKIGKANCFGLQEICPDCTVQRECEG